MQLRHPNELSKKAVEVLKWMADNESDDDLFVEGIQVWYGLNRTNYAVLSQLLECCFISEEDFGQGHYTINEHGKKHLRGEPPYTDGDGKAYESMFDMLKAGE